MKTQIPPDYSVIARDFEDQMREITEQKNRISQWIGDYTVMLLGLIIMAFGIFSFKELSQSISELAPTPEVARANIDRVSIWIGSLGIQMANSSNIVSLGMAFVGIGLAINLHRSSSRTSQITSQITVASFGVCSRIILRAIHETREANVNSNVGTVRQDSTGKQTTPERKSES